MNTKIGWATWGDVRGLRNVLHKSELAAAKAARKDQRDCEQLGGYSDRSVYWVDEDGYLRRADGGFVSRGAGRPAIRLTAR